MINNINNMCFDRTAFHPILPLVYDDALSYIEQLSKVTYKLNEMINLFNELETDILDASKAYTDQQISIRLKNVDDKIEHINKLISSLESDYEIFIKSVDVRLSNMYKEIEGFNNNLIASVNAVNERTDAVVKNNNDNLLKEMRKFLNEIEVTNYITGEDMSIQAMFDYLCLYHLTNAITYTGLANKNKTYNEYIDYNMTYTQLATNGGTIIV